jgi:hypothetical protein
MPQKEKDKKENLLDFGSTGFLALSQLHGEVLWAASECGG